MNALLRPARAGTHAARVGPVRTGTSTARAGRVPRARATLVELLPVLAIAVAVAATRLPFMADQLWAWDSVLYARALERGFHVDFELAGQRPQPPGYILYLAFASLFRVAGASTNAALVLVSVLAGAAGAAAVFVLGRRLAGPVPGAIAALAYACNPLAWMYASIAYPYALLGALSVSLAALFHHARDLGLRWWALASLAFGLCSGFRQDLLLLVGVLWLWMLARAGWRDRAIAAACVAAGIVVWLVPTAALSGGLDGYLTALARQTDHVASTYSVQAQGLSALSFNLRFTVYALAWGLLGFAVVLGGAGLARLLASRAARGPLLGPHGRFFAAWLLPGLAFYVAVHIGEWGYVLSVLPGLYVLAAVAIAHIAAAMPGRPRVAWRTLAAVVALAPALIFLASAERFSAAAIRSHDEALTARVAYVRATFATDRTIVLAREDFLLVRHYLPQFRAWLYDPEPHRRGMAKSKKAMRTTTFVLFTEGLQPRPGLQVTEVEVAPGVSLSYFTVEPGEVIEFSGEYFMVRDTR